VPGLPGWLYWVTAVIATLLFFGSVLAHELAHSLVARLRGLPVKSITLFVFGGVSNIEREPQSAVVEFQMAFIGPLTSLAIGGVMALAMFASAALGWPALLTAVLMYVGLANLALGVFNLIPGFPMDGGRVLRAIIWRLTGSLRKATQWAASVGQAIAFLMIFVGIWLFFSGDWVDGVWIGLIGLFILQAAQAEYTQVRLEATMAGATVQQFMTSSPPLATPDLLIEQVVDEYLLRTGQRTIPVVERDNNQLVGVVSLRDIRQIPRDRWDSTTVGQIMTPRSQLKTVQPDQPMSEALNTMTQARVGQLPVLSRDDRVIGMLDLTAVLEHLQLEHDLGVQRSEVNDVSNQPSQNPPLSKVG
jgi:Zn-dependent protease